MSSITCSDGDITVLDAISFVTSAIGLFVAISAGPVSLPCLIALNAVSLITTTVSLAMGDDHTYNPTIYSWGTK